MRLHPRVAEQAGSRANLDGGQKVASEQQRKGSSRSEDEAPEPEAADGTAVAARKEQLDTDVDDILDEIDGVLEENAAEFVSSFVQKGGE